MTETEWREKIQISGKSTEARTGSEGSELEERAGGAATRKQARERGVLQKRERARGGDGASDPAKY